MGWRVWGSCSLSWSTAGLLEVLEVVEEEVEEVVVVEVEVGPVWWSTEVQVRVSPHSWADHHSPVLLTHSPQWNCKQVSWLFAAKQVD